MRIFPFKKNHEFRKTENYYELNQFQNPSHAINGESRERAKCLLVKIDSHNLFFKKKITILF